MKSNQFTHKIKETIPVEENLTKRLKEITTKSNLLLHLMHELAQAQKVSQLTQLTTDCSNKIFGTAASAVYIVENDRLKLSSLSVAPGIENFHETTSMKEFSLDSSQPLVQAFNNKEIVSFISKAPDNLTSTGIKYWLHFPVHTKDENFGVFSLGFEKNIIISSDDIKLGELIALHLGVKIHNKLLLESSTLQNQTLELMQDSVQEGLSLHGPDGVIYYANKAIAKFFGNTADTVGVKREDLVGNWGKYHKYKVTRLYDAKEMNRVVYEENKPFINNYIIVHSNPPKIIEANYYPVVKNGKFGGMAAAYRDVTKEKKQEDELNENFKKIQKERDRWLAVFSNVDEGVCLIDKNLNITHMNTACEESTGVDLKTALGQLYFKVFNCHTPSGLYFPDFNPLEKILITKEPVSYEEHLHTNSQGEETWVGVSAAPVKDDQGEIQEIVVVIRDINSIKEIEKAKSQFVSIASHELRTPLTVINGYLSLLMNGDLGDFEDKESRDRLKVVLGKVSGETNRLTHLVSDLLNVSRIEEKRIQLNKTRNNIREIVEEVVEELNYVAYQKKVNLKIEAGKNSDLYAVFDKSKILQVLINLVDNAIKFTNNGGDVIIKYWQENGKIFIKVQDSGIGIPKKLQSIIFEKFQQVPGSYLKENRGTGLGLYIVKSLIELHDGQIEVESDPGKGSSFMFNLPS